MSALVLLATAMSAAAIAAPSGAATKQARIPPSSLAISPRVFPGFAGARRTRESAPASAQALWEAQGSDPIEASEEIAAVEALGFQDAVIEQFRDRTHVESLYEIQAFASRAGALGELRRSARRLTAFTRRDVGFKRLRDPAMPRAVVISEFVAREENAATNVLFVLGRCVVLAGDAVDHVSTRADSTRAIFAAAHTIKRAKAATCSAGG